MIKIHWNNDCDDAIRTLETAVAVRDRHLEIQRVKIEENDARFHLAINGSKHKEETISGLLQEIDMLKVAFNNSEYRKKDDDNSQIKKLTLRNNALQSSIVDLGFKFDTSNRRVLELSRIKDIHEAKILDLEKKLNDNRAELKNKLDECNARGQRIYLLQEDIKTLKLEIIANQEDLTNDKCTNHYTIDKLMKETKPDGWLIHDKNKTAEPIFDSNNLAWIISSKGKTDSNLKVEWGTVPGQTSILDKPKRVLKYPERSGNYFLAPDDPRRKKKYAQRGKNRGGGPSKYAMKIFGDKEKRDV